jgi:hypothetical protein
MKGRRDATGRRRRGGTRHTRSRASVAARQVVTTHGVDEVKPAWPQDEVATHGVVDDEPGRGGVVDNEWRDEPRDEPRDVQRHPDARRRRSSQRR